MTVCISQKLVSLCRSFKFPCTYFVVSQFEELLFCHLSFYFDTLTPECYFLVITLLASDCGGAAEYR